MLQVLFQFEQMLQSQDSIAEQSFSLLKQQATKIKVQSRDLELKDEQVQFLKETILALQQEKDILAHQNHQIKSKLKTMAAQISHYNTTVVQKIYQENQDLAQKISELKQQTQSLVLERTALLKRIAEQEQQLIHTSKANKQAGQSLQKCKEAASKYEKKLELMQKQNKELQHKNISFQRQLQEKSNQISYCSQQIDILTQKHHEALKNSERKLKSAIQKLVPKELLQQLEKQLKQITHKNRQLKSDFDKVLKEKEYFKFQLVKLKQKLLHLEIKEDTQYLQLRTDLVTLLQSLKIGKKITQFQSKDRQTAQDIYDCYLSVLHQNQKITRALQLSQARNQKAQSQKNILCQKLKNAEIELETLSECRQNQKEAIEAEYQSKLMEISIRLKKEEIALAHLRNKESALEALQEQFEKQVQDRQTERQTLNRTIQQLQKEIGENSSQLRQALQLCEQNMLSRQCITHYKYTLQDIVAIVHYLYQLLLQNKARNKTLFMPFINHYFEIKHVIDSHQRPKLPLRKLRGFVWVVIAIFRMRKQQSVTGRGLERYSLCAVERRYKIQNLGLKVEKMSSLIIKGHKANEILKESQEIYRWKAIEYMGLNIAANKDSKLLEKMVGLVQ